MRYGGRALLEGLRERHANGNGNGNGNGAAPFPIQESIDVAVPLGGAFELCSQFLDFPDRERELEVEITDERDDERIERAARHHGRSPAQHQTPGLIGSA